MYEYVQGVLKEKKETLAVIDVQGVGYRLQIPISSFVRLSSIGEKTLFYTRLIIKEDGHFLFGFLTQEEREKFDLLINISGIGPKIALNLVGHLDGDLFYSAISEANTEVFSKIPGIGNKTAKRIILEIQDKLKNTHSTKIKGSQLIHDGINALVNLGYQPQQAQKAIQKAFEKNKPTNLANLISTALQKL